MIVDHWIGLGTAQSAINYFQTGSGGNSTSTHFIVGTDGRIYQLLDLADTAYQAGNFDVNLLSVGIEHEITPTLPASDLLYKSSIWLHRHILDQFSLGPAS